MPSIHVIRRSNLLALYTRYLVESAQKDPAQASNNTDTAFANSMNLAKSSFASYKSGSRVMGERVARQIESLLKLSNGWMDEDRSDALEQKDEVAELAKFIKLATRAFKRADKASRRSMTNTLLKSLKTRET